MPDAWAIDIFFIGVGVSFILIAIAMLKI